MANDPGTVGRRPVAARHRRPIVGRKPDKRDDGHPVRVNQVTQGDDESRHDYEPSRTRANRTPTGSAPGEHRVDEPGHAVVLGRRQDGVGHAQDERVRALDAQPDAGPRQHRHVVGHVAGRGRAAAGTPSSAATRASAEPFVTPRALISSRTSSEFECVTVTRCSTCPTARSTKVSASWWSPSTRASSFTTRRPRATSRMSPSYAGISIGNAGAEGALVGEGLGVRAVRRRPLDREADAGHLGAQGRHDLVERVGVERERLGDEPCREVDEHRAVRPDADTGVTGRRRRRARSSAADGRSRTTTGRPAARARARVSTVNAETGRVGAQQRAVEIGRHEGDPGGEVEPVRIGHRTHPASLA